MDLGRLLGLNNILKLLNYTFNTKINNQPILEAAGLGLQAVDFTRRSLLVNNGWACGSQRVQWKCPQGTHKPNRTKSELKNVNFRIQYLSSSNLSCKSTKTRLRSSSNSSTQFIIFHLGPFFQFSLSLHKYFKFSSFHQFRPKVRVSVMHLVKSTNIL